MASPVEWLVEFRCFCLDGQVRTPSPYLREGKLSSEGGYQATVEEFDAATGLAERILNDGRIELPRSIVLDVGCIKGQGWGVVEANAAWGSGIYNCDPDEVLDVIRYAVRRNDQGTGTSG